MNMHGFKRVWPLQCMFSFLPLYMVTAKTGSLLSPVSTCNYSAFSGDFNKIVSHDVSVTFS